MPLSHVDTQAFLYRVVTTNSHIEAMIDAGRLVEPPVRASQRSTGGSPLDDFTFDARLQAKRMGSVYELLYCLENSMRELIESTLREVLGPEDWWTDGVPEAMRKSADKRREEDEKARWHGRRGASPLVYTDFPQLAEIIVSRWSDFADLIGDRTWLEAYFKEMNRSRRALAHTGALTEFDVERMEMRVREWLRVVG